MRDAACNLDIPVIDMQRWMEAHYDDGSLWWDRVHLSSLGPRLFAEGVFQERALLLRGADGGVTAAPCRS
ncbi:MAG: hypothetical protein CL910_06105 [Deltaproteobacteria bacterium]|jgi:hypothetical protein|nr:hypothetical protein [Deltaproteobacteria bacterium]